MLEIDTTAPEFSLKDSEGTEHSLSEFKGSYIILYFYPRDNTPGCTTEACAFRDSALKLTSLDAVIIGVSSDSVSSHKRFKEKYHLPFLLLSDPKRTMMDTYGAVKEKTRSGKVSLKTIRMTYIIDKRGKIITCYPKVTPKEHASQIQEFLEEQP